MSEPQAQHLLLRAFCDELARSGVRHACTSPGSRCAPIVLALAREPGLRSWSQIDERSAGFFALGVARASGRPAVITCTSGTAAANYMPAVVEAQRAGLPLIVVTADRPPELRDNGAGQAIDQLKLYGDAAKWFFEVGTHDATAQALRWVRTLACRCVATATGGRPGVVHVNWPLREPLVVDHELPADDTARAGAAPYVSTVAVAHPDHGAHGSDDSRWIADRVRGAQRPVIVAGELERASARIGEAVGALGVPILADPLSGLRTGRAAIAHYDALLRNQGFATEHAPDLVVRLGDLPTSKPLREWLASIDATQIAIDPLAAWRDPAAVVAHRLAADPGEALAAIAGVKTDADWLASWRAADERAKQLIANALGDELSEPAVASAIATAVPADGALVVAASMPIRDVETFFPVLDGPPRVLANRGANGIDGTIATALGAASTGLRTTVLIGDVALVHDLGSLVSAARLGLDLVVVVLDNGGGGIFDFLAVSGQRDVYEQHVATPPGVDFELAAQLARFEYEAPASVDEVARAARAGGRRLIHVRTDRARNVELHREIWAALTA